ncbi:MAG: hypothetical protein ACI9KE_000263 [Polyangiales bacterium]|jgi:hypothetical protein
MNPQLRGALLILFVLVNFAEGCPLVPNIRAHHLENPIGARELARWGTRLRGLGFELSDEELATRTLAASASASTAHAAMLEPVAPYFHALRIHQRWSLFPIADPDPWWMHIEGRRHNDWTLLYRPLDPLGHHDPALDDLIDTLEYRRIRGHWNPGTSGPRADYTRFVDWASSRICAADEDFSEIRVRFLRSHISEPGEDVSVEQTWHFEERRPCR